jgi:hypothetical protein
MIKSPTDRTLELFLYEAHQRLAFATRMLDAVFEERKGNHEDGQAGYDVAVIRETVKHVSDSLYQAAACLSEQQKETR